MRNRIIDTQFPMAALLTATLLLGPSSTCGAITIGIGGEVLLVPYVLCETDDTGGAPIFNTMIGVTTEPLPDTSGDSGPSGRHHPRRGRHRPRLDA